jgi:hypothetical protein
MIEGPQDYLRNAEGSGRAFDGDELRGLGDPLLDGQGINPDTNKTLDPCQWSSIPEASREEFEG